MDKSTNFDPRNFGGEAPDENELRTYNPPTPAPAESGVPVDINGQRVNFNEVAAAGTLSQVAGQATQDSLNQPTATYGQSLRAAWDESSLPGLHEFLTEPNFEPRPGYTAVEQMKLIDFTPTEDEHKFLGTSNSEDQFQFRADRIATQRKNNLLMADNPKLAFAVSALDPGYIALDLVGFGAGRAATIAGLSARAARMSAAGVAGVGAYALGKAGQQIKAVSEAEIVANALLQAGATAVAWRKTPGKELDPTDAGEFVPHDPAYPAAELRASATKAKAAIPEPEVMVVRAEGDELMGAPSRASYEVARKEVTSYSKFEARPAASILDELASGGSEWSTLAREFRGVGRGVLDNMQVRVVPEEVLTKAGTRSHYNPRLHEVVVTSLEPRVMMHEIAHGLTVHKLGYGLQNPKTAHGAVVEKLESIRAEAQAHLKLRGMDKTSEYLSGDPFEFVAGLFWGKSKFTNTLAQIPSRGGNLLTRMVDGVRQLLGMAKDKESLLTDAIGLTEELMALPLDVVVKNSDRSFTMHFAPPNPTAPAASIAKSQDSWASKLGNKIAWNAHKTMSGMGPMGKRVADLLVDNPVDMRGDSVVSQKRAIRSDLSVAQYRYEDALKEEMAVQGASWRKRITDPAGSMNVQKRIERRVVDELLRRDREARVGHGPASNATAAVQKMADALGDAFKGGLDEMKAAGVLGADAVQTNRGYFPRKWAVTNIEDMERALQAQGLTETKAKRRITEAVAAGMRRATPGMDIEVSEDIAGAILSRARSKGYFEDAAFRRHIGNEGAKEVRDILSSSGISPERLQRALDAITGQVDEASKLSSMKHRMDVDMTVGVHFPDGKIAPLSDLIDTGLTRLVDGYLDDAAGQAALARKGLVSAGDIDKLRTEFLHSIEDTSTREQAAKLFDNFIADIKGNPTGEDMEQFMRYMQAMTQMTALSASGLWQVTETAVIAQKYGMAKTVKHALASMPGFRTLLDEVYADPNKATHLREVLTRNASQDVRIRPYVQKMEDNYVMRAGDTVGLALQQAKQAVPYLNAMKYVQRWQARMTSNLVVDTFQRAAKGDADALSALNKYGLESHTMDSLKADLLASGMDTSKWTDATWQAVRGPLGKMMDDAVLHNRTGEIPAFAQFSQVGKFVFSFRSFVLGAHNKVLAGTLNRDGMAGLSLLLLYQYPLTFLATAANTGMSGKDKTVDQIAAASLSQMGAVGLFGELFGVATGQKQQFGAPGLIALDRVYRVGAGIAAGDSGATGAALLQATPILAILPPTRAIAETLKD